MSMLFVVEEKNDMSKSECVCVCLSVCVSKECIGSEFVLGGCFHEDALCSGKKEKKSCSCPTKIEIMFMSISGSVDVYLEKSMSKSVCVCVCVCVCVNVWEDCIGCEFYVKGCFRDWVCVLC